MFDNLTHAGSTKPRKQTARPAPSRLPRRTEAPERSRLRSNNNNNNPQLHPKKTRIKAEQQKQFQTFSKLDLSR
jgi:hypothetical protein